jgi:hypothetical protein
MVYRIGAALALAFRILNKRDIAMTNDFVINHTYRTSPMAQQDADRRRIRRQRVLLTGLVVHHDFRVSFPCTIRSLSDGGARISIPDDWQALTNFWLIRTTAGLAHEAAVTWRRSSLAGLKLSPEFDLADPRSSLARRLSEVLTTAPV